MWRKSSNSLDCRIKNIGKIVNINCIKKLAKVKEGQYQKKKKASKIQTFQNFEVYIEQMISGGKKDKKVNICKSMKVWKYVGIN